MVRGGLVRVIPVVMFFVIIAGMLSLVLIPVNIEIYGTVTDNQGNPLAFAYVTVGVEAHLPLAERPVDSQGHYSLFIHQYGEYQVWAGVGPLWGDYHYWSQIQKVKFESNNKNIRQRMDFQLISDIPCNVTLIASFWSVDFNHTGISWGYAQSGTITTLVKSMDPHQPYSSTAIDYERNGTTEGSDHSGGGHVLLSPCMIAGTSSGTPGEVISYSVYQVSKQGSLGIPAMDYLSPENATGGWIEEIKPLTDYEVNVNVVGNYTLPAALSVPVNVDILGKPFQTVLPCTMLGPNPGTLFIWVNVTNLDSVPHSYEFFVEGGHIIHVWEIS